MCYNFTAGNILLINILMLLKTDFFGTEIIRNC